MKAERVVNKSMGAGVRAYVGTGPPVRSVVAAERPVLSNHLLAAFPETIRQRIVPELEGVCLKSGQSLYEPAHEPKAVYFPTSAIVDLLGSEKDGATVGLAMVGNEGIIGIAALMGHTSAPDLALVQSPGRAMRLEVRTLRAEFGRDATVRAVLLRYVQALIVQISQTALCARHHSVEQQLCRWLLSASDGLGGSHLNVTQEAIAVRLGVRREGVSNAAGKLQRVGIIDAGRGRITILERERLQARCCACYGVVRDETRRLLRDVSSASSRFGEAIWP